MGVESATYIDGLTTTWPLSTDQKTQGDDHLRLLKAVLQATFPITGRALRPYRTAAKTGAYSVLATDDMTLFLVNASGGAFNLTLPAVPSVPFRIGVMKIGGDTNAVGFVGTVNGGSAASINYPGQYTEIFGDGTSYHQPLVGMLPNDYVTFARMQNIATDRLIGRDTAASGDPEEVTILQALEWVAALARGDLLTRGALTMGRLAIGAAGRYLRSDGTDPLWALPYAPLFHIRKESSSGTNGQNMTAATWNQLALDATVQNQITGASLGTNEFTLPAGTFRFKSFPASAARTMALSVRRGCGILLTERRRFVAPLLIRGTVVGLSSRRCGETSQLQRRRLSKSSFGSAQVQALPKCKLHLPVKVRCIMKLKSSR
jgi:hypothetical protein